eukprot:CAMPEP_0206615992 /NCGR_PEP_ID=MMETSP0325_2-20121206/58675_1 /ASSEMBLY_ACC=CAM_ASM_000347 /TAXON_ID=2866 /ORGANISM="Crypthecodinium cohnii, Strain Seligo" /LENGTH=80 /DNA_ID=CAMNT_0054137501 /DNA_START=36 /DNA_END=276 /DNA_ORIENTATION=-
MVAKAMQPEAPPEGLPIWRDAYELGTLDGLLGRKEAERLQMKEGERVGDGVDTCLHCRAGHRIASLEASPLAGRTMLNLL